MSNFTVGQIVKYSKPVNEDEKAARFIVLEITPEQLKAESRPELGTLGEKLTVKFICDMNFPPINTFFSEEFTPA